MLQHIQGRRPTEIDALNGALVKRAYAHGIPVPANEMIVAAVKASRLPAGATARRSTTEALEAAARADPRKGRWGSA